MNFSSLFRTSRLPALLLAGLVLSRVLPAAGAEPALRPDRDYEPTDGEFDFVGKAVVDLLRTRDAARFATNLSVSASDWQSVVTTNLSAENSERIKSFAKGAGYNVQRLESAAKSVLRLADSLHPPLSGNDLRFRIPAPRSAGKVYLTSPMENSGNGPLTLPHVQKLDLVLFRGADGSKSTNGAFKLAVRGLQKFPTGWRISDGIQWMAVPAHAADANTLRALAIQEKVAARKPLTSADDPALLKFAQTLVRFIRERNPDICEKELLVTADYVWAMIEKSGEKGPSRREVDEEIGRQSKAQLSKAGTALKMMETAGIDLKNADIQIKEASVERCQSARASDSLDGLMGSQFKLSFSVKTDGKAANGTSLSGDYVFAAGEIMRAGDEWKVADGLHWERLPDGVVDARTEADLKLENYVAQHGTLPPQSVAPAIEFSTLVDGKKMNLSDLRGKVVILDFWATWCGPCQEPMAELQKIRERHPDWKDRVAIVPLSIDDELDIVRKHVNQRGWTNTFNVWAGAGGWHSAPAQAFRVRGVPTTYVIDQQGRITWAGHPFGNYFENGVEALLKK